MKPAILLVTAIVLSIPVILLSNKKTNNQKNPINIEENSNLDFIQKVDIVRLR